MDWLVSIIELIAKYLTTKKNKWSFVLHTIACIIWTYIFIKTKQYGALLCIAVFLGLNVKGWIDWSKDEKEKKYEKDLD